MVETFTVTVTRAGPQRRRQLRQFEETIKQQNPFVFITPIHRRLPTGSGGGGDRGGDRGDGRDGCDGGDRGRPLPPPPLRIAIKRLQLRVLDGTGHARIGAESLTDDIRMAGASFIRTVHCANSKPALAIIISINVTWWATKEIPLDSQSTLSHLIL